jgi:hypothetical protein
VPFQKVLQTPTGWMAKNSKDLFADFSSKFRLFATLTMYFVGSISGTLMSSSERQQFILLKHVEKLLP